MEPRRKDHPCKEHRPFTEKDAEGGGRRGIAGYREPVEEQIEPEGQLGPGDAAANEQAVDTENGDPMPTIGGTSPPSAIGPSHKDREEAESARAIK